MAGGGDALPVGDVWGGLDSCDPSTVTGILTSACLVTSSPGPHGGPAGNHPIINFTTPDKEEEPFKRPAPGEAGVP